MTPWQQAIDSMAERAGNRCISCGEYGHYPVECPREQAFARIRENFGMLEPASIHNEFWPRLIMFACGLISGGVVGWWLK